MSAPCRRGWRGIHRLTASTWANGILLLDTCELVPHTPELLTPIQLPVAYEPDAECPEIERALTGILPDATVRRVFYEVVGYLLTADNSLQRAFMFLAAARTASRRWSG